MIGKDASSLTTPIKTVYPCPLLLLILNRMTRRSSGRVSKGASTSYKDDFEDSDSISVDQEDDKDSNFSLANDAPGSDWDNWDKDDDEDDEDAVDEEDQEEEEEEGAEGDDSRTSLSGAETPQDQSNKRRRVSASCRMDTEWLENDLKYGKHALGMNDTLLSLLPKLGMERRLAI